MPDQENAFAKELDTRIWKTKGSRYNKSRRYKTKNKLSLLSISILTIYVLAISIAEQTKLLEKLITNCEVVSLFTIVISIAILVLSLHESSHGYEVKSERLYNCGNELTVLYNNLRQIILTNTCNNDNLSEINNQYESIISKYRENQDPCDYQLFQAEHHKDFDICWFSAQLIRIKYNISQYWIYFSLIILPLILFGSFAN